jgi:hypothetical protein
MSAANRRALLRDSALLAAVIPRVFRGSIAAREERVRSLQFFYRPSCASYTFSTMMVLSWSSRFERPIMDVLFIALALCILALTWGLAILFDRL